MPWLNARPSGAEVQRTNEAYTVTAYEGGHWVFPRGLALDDGTVELRRASDSSLLTRVTTTPGAGQYRVNFDPAQAMGGAVEMNAAEAGIGVLFTYKDRGSLVWASDMEKVDTAIQTAVAGDGISIARTGNEIAISRLFDPRDLGGLRLWLAARKETPVADGTAIVPTDFSPDARALQQATVSKRPLYKVNQRNGQPGFLFDGVDDWVRTTNAFTLSHATFYFVFKATLDQRFLYEMGENTNSSDGSWIYLHNGNTTRFRRAFILTDKPAPVDWYNKNSYVMVCQRFRGDYSSHKLYRNGVSVDGTESSQGDPLSNTVNHYVHVGAHVQGTQLFFGGVLCEMLVFDSGHGDETRAKVQDWLSGADMYGAF